MRKLATLLGLSGLLLTAAPAFATTDQVLRIFTFPDKDAHCLLENELGAWTVQHAPQNVSIQPSQENLTISCRSADGMWSGKLSVGTKFNPGILLTWPMNLFDFMSALVVAPMDIPAAKEAWGTATKYPNGIIVPMTRDVAEVPVATPVEPVFTPPAPAPAPVHRARRVVHHKPKPAPENCVPPKS